MNNLADRTNTNFNGGPNINGTGTADINGASMNTENDADIIGTYHNIKRNDLCVSRQDNRARGYVNVISADYMTLPATHPPNHSTNVDQSMRSYYIQKYDARSKLEEFMAHYQICFISDEEQKKHNLMYFQAFLVDQCGELKTLHTATTAPTAANYKFRKNVIRIHFDEEGQASIKFRKATNNANNEAGDARSKYDEMQEDTEQQKSMMQNIVVHELDIHGKMSENMFTDLLWTALEEQFTSSKVQVYNNKATLISPPEYIYAGVALTDAYMHPRNGDTAVTINYYGAMTTDNGPGDVICGDNLMWMFECEKHYFDSKGSRYSRNVMTESALYAIISDITINNFEDKFYQYLKNIAEPKDKHYSNPRANRPGADDRTASKYGRIVIMPLRQGFRGQKLVSRADRRRIIGKALSSSSAYHRLDWINGASPEM